MFISFRCLFSVVLARKMMPYRTTSELLKKEKYYYENQVGEYSESDELKRKKVLVERIESIVSSETSKYFTVHQPKQKQSQSNQ
jgi:hypothetical protein